MTRHVAAFFVIALIASSSARSASLALSLNDAEQRALAFSFRLKASNADVQTAQAQANAAYANLFPKLSLNANYTFLSTLPEVKLGQGPAVTFGDHSNYHVGPQLTYTLWDTFSILKNYRALEKVKESRNQDKVQVRAQLLMTVRSAYLRVQLAIEELRLVTSSLELAMAQQNDIKQRFDAGAATSLDTLIAKRHVSAFKLLFDQRQADLSVALKDLLSLTGDSHPDLTRPGLAGMAHVALVLSFDALGSTITLLRTLPQDAPSDDHPQVKSQTLLKTSAELSAESLRSKLFPSLSLSMGTALVYPNGPQLVNISQNTIALSFSVPLYLGDPTWELIEQRRSEARAAHYRARQTELDLNRDHDKALQLLASLESQRTIASQDTVDAETVAKLYFASYKGGKANLIDVHAANNQAFQAKINVARLDAQIVNQLISLVALSGKDIP